LSEATARSRAEVVEDLIPRFMRILYRSIQDSVLSDLPLAQMRIIRLLYSGSRTVTALGEELDLTPSAITQLANRLQDGGLVLRVEDREDRRVRHLALTSHARDIMKARQERRIRRMQDVLEKLSGEDQQRIVDSLGMLLDAAGEITDKESLPFVAELEQAVPPFTK
jgi:DNA-binding MarR family transcriptional regulator